MPGKRFAPAQAWFSFILDSFTKRITEIFSESRCETLGVLCGKIIFTNSELHMYTAKDKLIVALDVDSQSRALDLFERLREHVGMFKVGIQLFTAAGPDVVRKIVASGSRVFLDLKYHDIPNTVAMAAIEAT